MVEYSYGFHSAGNIKDDVRPEMFIVAANDCPLLATLPTRPVGAKLFEWFVDTLPNPTSVAAAEAEATVTTGATGTRPRWANVVTKYTEDFFVTNTLRAVDQHMVTDEYYYKAQKAALALAKRFDTLLHWGTYVAYGSAASVPRSVGIIPWLQELGMGRAQSASTTVVGPNTISSTYYPYWKDCYKDSTALSEGVFQAGLATAYNLGTSISDCIGFCGATVKNRLSNFQMVYNTTATTSAHDVSVNRTMQKEMKTRQVAMDYYDSDFGTFGIVIDRRMTASFSFTTTTQTTSINKFVSGGDDTIFFIDPAYFSKAVLRDFGRMDLAPTDDSQRGYVVAEMGLEVGNPLAGFGFSRTDNAA